MRTLDLRGKVALVTGASSGIGRACALALAEEGAAVGVNYSSSADSALAVVEQIERAGGRARAIQADVSNEDDVGAMFALLEREFGPLDVLVSNAGIQADAPFEEMTFDDWTRVLQVNLTGAFLSCQAAVRQFLTKDVDDTGRRGSIIAVSSVHDTVPWAGHANYAVSKAGLTMLGKTLAVEYAGRNIQVNVVVPGAIRTAINEDVWSDESSRSSLEGLIPMGRIGDAADVAEVVRWLASRHSRYVTGASISVDGGMLLYPGLQSEG